MSVGVVVVVIPGAISEDSIDHINWEVALSRTCVEELRD